VTRPSPQDGLSDEELACAFQADPRGPSGRAAVEALLGRYHARVYRWCAWRIRDPERALELAQEAMFAALESLPRFDGRSRFSSWLYAITRNRCVSAVRSDRLRHWRRDTEVDPEELPVEDDPHARLKAREGEDRLLELMRTELEPLEQDALWLRVIEERTVPEITELLKIESASGARGVLQNARRKLRAALARERRPSS
jgi:RNA polymerase sigma-70 factor (ECF subfamily)